AADERGVSRPQGQAADLGAFELMVSPPATTPTTPTTPPSPQTPTIPPQQPTPLPTPLTPPGTRIFAVGADAGGLPLVDGYTADSRTSHRPEVCVRDCVGRRLGPPRRHARRPADRRRRRRAANRRRALGAGLQRRGRPRHRPLPGLRRRLPRRRLRRGRRPRR